MSTAAALPIWVQYVQVFATPLVAIVAGGLAAWIAYRQWRTAAEKLSSDLFDRRWAVYDEVLNALAPVFRAGRPLDNEPLRRLHAANAKAQFLFGPEVSAYLDKLIEGIANLGVAADLYQRGEADQAWLDKMHAARMLVATAQNDLRDLCRPYMRMSAREKPRRFRFSLWRS